MTVHRQKAVRKTKKEALTVYREIGTHTHKDSIQVKLKNYKKQNQKKKKICVIHFCTVGIKFVVGIQS